MSVEMNWDGVEIQVVEYKPGVLRLGRYLLEDNIAGRVYLAVIAVWLLTIPPRNSLIAVAIVAVVAWFLWQLQLRSIRAPLPTGPAVQIHIHVDELREMPFELVPRLSKKPTCLIAPVDEGLMVSAFASRRSRPVVCLLPSAQWSLLVEADNKGGVHTAAVGKNGSELFRRRALGQVQIL